MLSSWLRASRSVPSGTFSSSNTTLCGNPLLPVQVTDSPTLIVISSGTNTSCPLSDPNLTSAALATAGAAIKPTPTKPAMAPLRILSINVASARVPLTPSMLTFGWPHPHCPTPQAQFAQVQFGLPQAFTLPAFVLDPITAPTTAPAAASMATSDHP